MDLLVECLSDPSEERLRKVDFGAIEDDFIRIKLYYLYLHILRNDSDYERFSEELFPKPMMSHHQYALRSYSYRDLYILNSMGGLFTYNMAEDLARIHYRIAIIKTWFHKDSKSDLDIVYNYFSTYYAPVYLSATHTLSNSDAYIKGEFRQGISHLERGHGAILRDLTNSDLWHKEFFWENLFILLSNLSVNFARIDEFDKAVNFSQFLVQYYIHHHSPDRNTQHHLISHTLRYCIHLSFKGANKSELIKLLDYIIPMIEPEKTMQESLSFFRIRLLYKRYLGTLSTFKKEFGLFFRNTIFSWLFTIEDNETGYFFYLRETLRLLYGIIDGVDIQIDENREDGLTEETDFKIKVQHNIEILILLILYRKDKTNTITSLIILSRKIKMYDILVPLLRFNDAIYGNDHTQELIELEKFNLVYEFTFSLDFDGLEDFCWKVMSDFWLSRFFHRVYERKALESESKFEVDVSSLQSLADSQVKRQCDTCQRELDNEWIRCPFHK